MTPDSRENDCKDSRSSGDHVPETQSEPVGAQPDEICNPNAPHPLMHNYLDVAKCATIHSVVLLFVIALPVRLSMAYYNKHRE